MSFTPSPSIPDRPKLESPAHSVLNRRVRVAAIVGGCAGLAFAIFNLLTPGQALLGQIELASVFLVILPAIYLSFQSGYRVAAENLLMIGALTVFFAIAVLGGVQGTGLLWAFVIPFLAFFLKGQRAGLLISLGFVAACGFYFFGGPLQYAGSYNYGAVVEVQFLMALVFYTVVAAMFNLTQSRQDRQLRSAHEALQAAHLALSQSQKQFQFVADEAPVLIAHCSRDLCYRFVNKSYASLFGAQPDALVGRPVADYLGRKAYTIALPHMLEALRGEPVNYELTVPHASRGRRHLLVQYQPEHDSSGVVSGFVAAITDITRQKATEAALEEARTNLEQRNQEISRIVATASHDLRQPAHALGLLVSSLQPSADDASQRDALARAKASVDAMQNMLDAYFDYSWALARGENAHIEAVSITALFEEMGAWFHEKARIEQTRFIVRPRDIWVETDGLLLRRILLNLVSNALRYSAGGSVLLCCRAGDRGDEIRIQVRDNGIGIAQGEHEEVFKALYQSPAAPAQKEKGLGLGLSVVRGVCEKLGIPLHLSSMPHRGSCFTLRLTRRPAPTTADAAQESVHSDRRHDGQTVMLIEDSDTARAALRMQLMDWGYAVIACTDVPDALKQLDQGAAPDVLITDFQLPDSPNGLEGARLIRERLGRPLSACLVTGNIEPELMQQAREQGMGFLKKPFAPSKLRSWLQRQETRLAEPFA